MVPAKAEWEVGNGDYLLHGQFDINHFIEPWLGHEMRFRSLLIAMLLLIVFGGNAYATKPREAGIGIKYSFTNDSTFFKGTAQQEAH